MFSSASNQSYQQLVTDMFAHADIQINGDHPHDINVINPQFYHRFLKDGSLGLGESYMDGWWTCEQVDEMFYRLLQAMVYQRMPAKNLKFLLTVAKAKLWPDGSKERSHLIGEKHYDIGNELYEKMLDKRMIYSCGYWKNADNLNDAQAAKLELVCQKIGLKPGMKVLEVGCGWGGFAKYAAENYQVQVTGVTVSREQLAIAQQMCADVPVELRYQDYRDITEQFDRIVSIGMFEHVGLEYHQTFMKHMKKCLRDDGLFLLHTIVVNRSKRPDAWLEKYIFPGCRPPSMMDIGKALEGQLIVEDIHNFGPDYTKTLLAWSENFERSWPEIKTQYDEHFYRMWHYYLMTGAAAFKSRYSNLWQIVLSKSGLSNGYQFMDNYNIKSNPSNSLEQ